MKFSKVIGKIDEKLVAKAEEQLSKAFIGLCTDYKNMCVGPTFIGGDVLIFSLMYPVEHICTLNMPTAATDGKRYYWNPKFILKQSPMGLRLIISHEAWHALYMHPARRGSRLPKLWNIAVDYIVNNTIMEDLKIRKQNPTKLFTEHLGKYKTLAEYAEMLKDPFKDLSEADLSSSKEDQNIKLPLPGEDRELTPEEKKYLELREKKEYFFFADPDLEEKMRSPEKIYDFLYNLLPKCSKCGRVGRYKLPKNMKSSCSHKGCDECGSGIDIFDFGGTLDEHIDTEEDQGKLSKRIFDAMESAKRMAGYVPAALEEELGKLTAPKITWQDIIRTRLLKAKIGNTRNDWTRFRTRPLFAGVFSPKKKSYSGRFGCLLDTSGSMSKEDKAYGISQLQGLDERAEGVIVCAESTVHWDNAIKIKSCNAEELSKIKTIGGGGTIWGDFFSDYEKHIGKCDFLVILSDMYLMDTDIARMKDPGIDVYWICTSTNTEFKPPFGKLLTLS